LSALMTAGDLNVDYTDWGAPWGVFVSDLDYPDGLEYGYGASSNVGWAYYGSLDNETWAGNDGVSARQLTDGAYDSWVWSNYPADWSAPIRLPGQAPVPEPATLALLAAGGLLLRKKK